MNQFGDYYYRSFLAPQWSFQHLFCIFIYYLIVAIPFYFNFGGQYFWLDENFDLLQLNYQYTGYYALQSNYIDSTKFTQQYSTIPSSNINTLLDSSVTVDEQLTNTTITIALANYGSKTITSLNGAFFYDVQIPTLEKKLSVAYLFSVKGNFHTTSIKGQMYLHVGKPIDAIIGEFNDLANSPAYFTTNLKVPTSFAEISSTNIASNYSIETNAIEKSLKGLQADRTVTIELLKDREQILAYYPSLLETLKFKFSRYIGFVMVAYLVFRGFMVILIKNEALECSVEDESPPIK